jgi:hypothetical protein
VGGGECGGVAVSVKSQKGGLEQVNPAQLMGEGKYDVSRAI